MECKKVSEDQTSKEGSAQCPSPKDYSADCNNSFKSDVTGLKPVDRDLGKDEYCAT